MAERTFYEGAPDSSVLIKWVFTRLLPYTLGLGVVWLIIVAIVTASSESEGFSTTVVLGIAMIAVFVFFYLNILKMTYKYEITDRGVYFSSGVAIKTQKFVPFHKITNIVVSQDILECALGISNISIQTGVGGYAKPEIVFEGLAYPTRPNIILEECVDVRGVSSKYKSGLSFESLEFEEALERSAREGWPEDESIPTWEEIEKKVLFGEDAEESVGPVQEEETIKELFEKWKKGEISTDVYFEKKEKLKK